MAHEDETISIDTRTVHGLNADQIEQVRQIAREEIIEALKVFVGGATRGMVR